MAESMDVRRVSVAAFLMIIAVSDRDWKRNETIQSMDVLAGKMQDSR